MTWVSFQEGGFIPLDRLLPPLFQNPHFVQKIQETGRLGVLCLVAVHESVPFHCGPVRD